MSISIYNATTQLNDRTITVDPDPEGSQRGWASVDDMALGIAERVAETTMPLFSDPALSTGSQVGATLFIGGRPAILWDTVLSTLHKAYHETADLSRDTRGGAIRRSFNSHLQSQIGQLRPRMIGPMTLAEHEASLRGDALRLRMFGPPDTGVFQFNSELIPQDDIRALPLPVIRSNGRNTGVRSGSVSFRDRDTGSVARLREQLDVANRARMIGIIRSDPMSVFKIQDGSTRRSLTPEDTVRCIADSSCVILGLWLRFADTQLSRFVLDLLGHPTFGDGLSGLVSSNVRRLRTTCTLFWAICHELSDYNEVSEAEYRENRLDAPVPDCALFRVVKMLEVDAVVIHMNDLVEFVSTMEQTDTGFDPKYTKIKTRTSSGLAELGDIESLRRGRSTRAIVTFRGSKAAHKRRHDKTVVFICSRFLEDVAHVDVLFDKTIQDSLLLRNANHKFTHTIEYNRTDTETDGYFDRITPVTDWNKYLKPMRMYRQLKVWDWDDVLDRQVPEVVFVETVQQLKVHVADLLSKVHEMFALANVEIPKERADLYWSYFGRHYYIERSVIDETAYTACGSVPRGIVGLIYILSLFVKMVREAGLQKQISFSEFGSAFSYKRSRDIFSKVASRILSGDGFRAATVCTFDDVSTFCLDSTVPVKFKIEGQGRTKRKRGGPDPIGDGSPMRFATFHACEKDRIDVSRQLASAFLDSSAFKKKAWARVSDDIPQSADRRDRRRRAEAYNEIVSKFNPSAVAVMMSNSSFLSVVLAGHKGILAHINRQFATYPPIRDEMVYTIDPQIDEPIVPNSFVHFRGLPGGDVGGDDYVPAFDDGYYELDLNMCYTQVMLGRFDSILRPDLWGRQWFHGGTNRPIERKCNFVDDHEFLQSYQADHGYVMVGSIDFATLHQLLPDVFGPLSSWRAFSDEHDSPIERWIPCASVIHLTSLACSGLRGLSRFSGWKDPAIWRYVQRDLLRLQYVHFVHADAERKAILSAQSSLGDYRPLAEHLLKGLVHDEDKTTRAHETFARSYADAVDRAYKAVYRVTRDHKEAHKVIKLDCNAMVGMLKTGRNLGGINVQTNSDILRKIPVKDNGTSGFEFLGISVPYDRLGQVHVCPVPAIDMDESRLVLAELAYIKPVTLSGYPRTLRISILERARLMMDELVAVSRAFRVKTDAVFFKQDRLEQTVHFMNCVEREFRTKYPRFKRPERNGTGRTEQYPPAHEYAYMFRACRYDCGDDRINSNGAVKPCEDHAVFKQTGHPLKMMPFKLVSFPGLTCPIPAPDSDEWQTYVNRQSHVQSVETIHTSRRKMSIEGLRRLNESRSDTRDCETIRTSDMLPDIGDYLDAYHAQVRGEKTDLDKLSLHCSLRTNPSRPFFFLDEDESEGEILASTVDVGRFYDDYLQRLFRQMDDWDQGFLMEGPPGTGKSYAVCSYIKEQLDNGSTDMYFVATATHLTLEPYLELDMLENPQVCVSTIHSFVGVYTQMPQAAADPYQWFNTPQSGNRSRFIRTIRTSAARAAKRITIFVDEYEIMPVEFEQIILYLSETYSNARIVLLGDRKQTAAYDRGVRPDGEVVQAVTHGKVIHFDLPFRNPDAAFFRAQQQACSGKPTLFTEEPLCDYQMYPSMDCDGYTQLLDSVGKTFMEYGRDGTPYQDRVVSLQSYKMFTVFALQVIDRLYSLGELTDSDRALSLTFVGNNAFGMSNGDNGLGLEDGTPEIIGDQSIAPGTESNGQAAICQTKYTDLTTHSQSNDPERKRFLIGTRLLIRTGFSYRSMYAFIPTDERDKAAEFNSRRGEGVPAVKPRPVRMGKILVLETIGWNLADGHKSYTFVYDGSEQVTLSESEVRMHLFYPFCLYTEGVVGQTFSDYTMVNLYNPQSDVNHYVSIKKNLENAERYLGDTSWVSRHVKTMNVATTRLKHGSMLKLVEIPKGVQYFWHDVVFGSPWHIATARPDPAGNKATREEMRACILNNR